MRIQEGCVPEPCGVGCQGTVNLVAGKLRLRGSWTHGAGGRVGSEPGGTQSAHIGPRMGLVRQVHACHAVLWKTPGQSGQARLPQPIFLKCLPWLSAPLSVLQPLIQLPMACLSLGVGLLVPAHSWTTTP